MTPLPNSELAALLAQYAQGRSEAPETAAAQQMFYRHVRVALEGAVARLTRLNPELGEAAVQEAWREVFMNAHHYDAAAGSVIAWVRGIATNCARRELERERRATRLVTTDRFQRNRGNRDDWSDDLHDPIETAACPLPGPDRLGDSAAILRAIDECWRRLSNEGRVPYAFIYELAFDSDLTNAQLTRLVNEHFPERAPCNEEQVRKWVQRAGEKMTRCVAQRLRHPGARGT